MPEDEGVKFNIKLSESLAITFAGKETTEKSDEFTPEIVAEVIFSVSKVPRFSIRNVAELSVDTGELVI